MAAVKSFYEDAKAFFPSCKFAFAYGSAVFKQHGVPKGEMLDLVFVVEDPTSWHEENLQLNNEHYSSLKLLGPGAVAAVQAAAASVYFNPLVTVSGQLLKYGVISEQRFLEDLVQWTTLYISGRLHKPVVLLPCSAAGGPVYQRALQLNLRSALHTALLLAPERTSLEEFFVLLSSCSYRGDFRMIFGEDKHKVQNIVRPQVQRFLHLYSTHFEALSERVSLVGNHVEQDLSPASVRHHCQQLPAGLLARTPSLSRTHHDKREVQLAVGKGLESVVRRSSLSQSAKGLLTAGVGRSLSYSAQKVLKMFKSYLR